MTGNELLHKFNATYSLTKEEFERLECYLKYYSGYTMPQNSWFHNHLNDFEMRLLKDGAYASLLRVQDFMKMKGYL